jgi:2-oxoglutarate dehydrogenase N-terminus
MALWQATRRLAGLVVREEIPIQTAAALQQRFGVHGTVVVKEPQHPQPVPLSKLKDSFLDGTSSSYLEEIEERFRANPYSVDKTWASFFRSLGEYCFEPAYRNTTDVPLSSLVAWEWHPSSWLELLFFAGCRSWRFTRGRGGGVPRFRARGHGVAAVSGSCIQPNDPGKHAPPAACQGLSGRNSRGNLSGQLHLWLGTWCTLGQRLAVHFSGRVA